MAGEGPEVSVCIATRGRPGLLDACLASLQDQRRAPRFELLVCCQADAAGAPVVRARFPDAVVGLVEDAFPGGARNFLVSRARGELLLFLDDDVTCGPDLLRRLVDLAARHPGAAVFGGPNLTPPGSSLFQVVQGAALGSLVGSGPVRRRYGRHPAGEADERLFTLCNLAVRRSHMPRFPAELRGGEENAVLAGLAAAAAGMRYDPGLWVYHQRRRRFGPFAGQMFKYGRGRGQVMRRSPRTTRPFHLVALGYLLGLSAVVSLSVVASPWFLVVPAAYLAALAAGGLVICRPMRRLSLAGRAGVAALSVALFAAMHLAYSLGVVWGLGRGRGRDLVRGRGRGRDLVRGRVARGSRLGQAAAPASHWQEIEADPGRGHLVGGRAAGGLAVPLAADPAARSVDLDVTP